MPPCTGLPYSDPPWRSDIQRRCRQLRGIGIAAVLPAFLVVALLVLACLVPRTVLERLGVVLFVAAIASLLFAFVGSFRFLAAGWWVFALGVPLLLACLFHPRERRFAPDAFCLRFPVSMSLYLLLFLQASQYRERPLRYLARQRRAVEAGLGRFLDSPEILVLTEPGVAAFLPALPDTPEFQSLREDIVSGDANVYVFGDERVQEAVLVLPVDPTRTAVVTATTLVSLLDLILAAPDWRELRVSGFEDVAGLDRELRRTRHPGLRQIEAIRVPADRERGPSTLLLRRPASST